jgi:hypothetical protein
MPDNGDDWTLTGHPRGIVLHVPDGAGGEVTTWMSPDQATGMGLRLIQAAYAVSNATCTTPEATLGRVNELLAEVSG